ncbi:MAG TPA: MFS transporter [Pseudonocardiaceae bacterium]|nr:MFS transporter [Pseudonocardiaceae bacterium]
MSAPQEHPTVFGTVRAIPNTARMLILGVFVNNLVRFLNAFLVLFLVDRGFSTWHAGIALAALLVGRVFGTAVGGAVADRIGYRWTIIGSMTVGAALIVALVHAPDEWTAVAIAGLTGLVVQAYVPAATAWLVELTEPRQQVMVFAMIRLAFNVGATLGPLLATLLIVYGYELLFYADAAASLLFALMALVLLPQTRASSESSGSEPAAKRAGGYREVLADTRFMMFTAALFLTAVAYIQMSAALPLFVTGNGHSERIYALLLAINGFVVITLELVLSKWTQRLPVGVPMAAGMALLGAGYLVYLGPNEVAVLVIGTVVWTFGEVVAAPSILAYPGMVAPERLRARYIASATTPQQAGYAIGPVAGVAAWQLWGSTVWLLAAVFVGVAAVLVAVGVGLRGRPAQRSPQDAGGERPAQGKEPAAADQTQG